MHVARVHDRAHAHHRVTMTIAERTTPLSRLTAAGRGQGGGRGQSMGSRTAAVTRNNRTQVHGDITRRARGSDGGPRRGAQLQACGARHLQGSRESQCQCHCHCQSERLTWRSLGLVADAGEHRLRRATLKANGTTGVNVCGGYSRYVVGPAPTAAFDFKRCFQVKVVFKTLAVVDHKLVVLGVVVVACLESPSTFFATFVWNGAAHPTLPCCKGMSTREAALDNQTPAAATRLCYARAV